MMKELFRSPRRKGQDLAGMKRRAAHNNLSGLGGVSENLVWLEFRVKPEGLVGSACDRAGSKAQEAGFHFNAERSRKGKTDWMSV